MVDSTAPRGITRAEWIALLVGLPVLIAVIIAARPLVTDILNGILDLNPTMVYVVVSVLVFAEAAVFFGFVFPGETAVILGGVVASGGHVNVGALGALIVIAAIIGDSVGYFVGSRHGEKILKIKLLAHRRGGIDMALVMLRRRGALAVFIGRFTAFLRAVMPGLAGLSKMHYRTFLFANAIGGLVWGVLFTALGYFLGNAYHKAEKYAAWASTAILILIVLVAVGLFIRGRLAEQRVEATFATSTTDVEAALIEEIAITREALDDEEEE